MQLLGFGRCGGYAKLKVSKCTIFTTNHITLAATYHNTDQSNIKFVWISTESEDDFSSTCWNVSH